MDLREGSVYKGFSLVRKEEIKEIDSTAYLFEHEKTGASVLKIYNNEENNVFGISFRTPPFDDTGLPHILEHSVLAGSKNYPLKDPLVELVKSTLHTFINALTFPDKTVYPVASNYRGELFKMARVYLDAVFYPLVKQKKEIFLQEGWRFEQDEDGNLKYNGVVYSEMKGAFSSPMQKIERESLRSLFPSTSYGNEAGGDPREIPNLSYEMFLQFYEKYYHPSNSFIYFYGNGSISEELELLREYLDDFEKEDVESQVPLQDPFAARKEITMPYSVSPDEESLDGNYYFNLSYVVGDDINDPELVFGFDVLCKILLEMPSSPLKRALLDAELGEDVTGHFEKDVRQPFLSIQVSNSRKEAREKFKSVFEETLRKLVDEGIDKDLIRAAVNRKEFELRENTSDLPDGLVYLIRSLRTWLHGYDPLKMVRYEKVLEKIKNAPEGYFEGLIERYLLNNSHCMLLELEPDRELDEDKEISDKLDSVSKEVDMEEVKTNERRVRKFQEEEDRDSFKRKIEVMPLNKIERAPSFPQVNFDSEKGVFLYETDTKGVTYFNLCFEAGLSQEYLQYVALLEEVLEEIRTNNYGYHEWSNLVNIYMGELNFQFSIYEGEEGVIPKFFVNTKVLDENLGRLREIFDELFNEVVFDDWKVKEVLAMINSRYKVLISEKGHVFSRDRVESYFSEAGKLRDMTGGIGFYEFVKELYNNFEERREEVLSKLREVYESVFTGDGLLKVVVTGDRRNADVGEFRFRKGGSKRQRSYDVAPVNLKEGFKSKSMVQYVSKGFNFKKLGYDYTGSYLVLSKLLGRYYLWEELRVKGGAYGAKVKVNREGTFILSSFRDPNLANTLRVYDEVDEFLRDVRLGERDLNKYIIGVIGDFDYPLRKDQEARRELVRYIKGISREDIEKERQEVLDTSVQDLRRLSKVLKRIMEKDCYSVIGNDNLIEKESEKFNKIRRI